MDMHYFSNPPRLKKSRLHSLLSSLEQWRQDHPMRRIEHIQVAEDRHDVRGLNVFWSLFEHLQEQSRIAHFNIDEQIRELYGHEYAEALMQDALGFARDNPTPEANVAMVSRRKVVIAIVRATGQAYMTTLDKFLSTLERSVADGISQKFESWSAQEESGYFCAVLPDDYDPSK